MSTGLDCRFYEKAPGRWYYDLEMYSHRDEYDTYGPFPTFRAAYDHLHDHHANPGGYFIKALPGCKHDLKQPREHEPGLYDCDRCGERLDLRGDEQKRREKWQEALDRNADRLILAVLAQEGLTEGQRDRIARAGIPRETLDKELAGALDFWAKL